MEVQTIDARRSMYKRPARPERDHFKVVPFTNRTGSTSWRVTGSRRDGTRIRENYSDPGSAKNRQIELEAEYRSREPTDSVLRATTLTDQQIRIAQEFFPRFANDGEIRRSFNHWFQLGHKLDVSESPRLDAAFEQFEKWLDNSSLRPLTKRKKYVTRKFVRAVENRRVSECTPEFIEAYLSTLNVSPRTKRDCCSTISTFLGWCRERPRRWIKVNPCREVKIEHSRSDKAPDILTIDECNKLMRVAEAFKGGRWVPFFALCLFGGLRPFEAMRLRWDQINLTDGEIRIDGTQSKTGRSRVMDIIPIIRDPIGNRKGPDTLLQWLHAYEGCEIFPVQGFHGYEEHRRIRYQIGFGTRYDDHFRIVPCTNQQNKWRIIGRCGGTYYKNDHGRSLEKAQQRVKELEAEAKRRRESVPVLKPWVPDIMRHTAISHFVRLTGSYGDTAERFGNTEAIIKRHYQGRVTHEETQRFFAILPEKVSPNARKVTRIPVGQSNAKAA